MKGTKLVSVRIAHIREIEPATFCDPDAWRVFIGPAAVRNAQRVPTLKLVHRLADEPDSASVGVSRGLPVYRPGHDERGGIGRIHISEKRWLPMDSEATRSRAPLARLRGTGHRLRGSAAVYSRLHQPRHLLPRLS